MAVYVELRHKAFHQQLQRQTEKLSRRTWNVKGIRRPLVGIDVKEDTFCHLRVVAEDGKELMLAGQDQGTPYANFILNSWTQSHKEKMSILDTMGDTSFLYFFGRQPRMYEFSGILLNTADFNWRSQWLDNYDTYLRGTRLAQSRARVYLYVDGSVIEGYFASTDIPNDSRVSNLVNFHASFLVTDYTDLDKYYNPEGQPDEYITGLPDNLFTQLSESERKAYGWTYADVVGKASEMAGLTSSEANQAQVGGDTTQAQAVGEDVLKEGAGDLLHPSDKRSLWKVG